ncbi:hypothetical protein L581_3148 [Serratia fonticola AU-AP2C]|nr:hypothetical protein L581_3148 [Serratia fonticola AU-AP2C]
MLNDFTLNDTNYHHREGGIKSLQHFAQSTAAMVIFLYPRKIKFNLE